MLLGTLLLIMFAALCLGPHKAAASPSVIGCKRVQGIERRACIIRVTFGRHGADAVRVARCESGFDPAARDYLTGTHWGVFQLGPAERRAYGHGRTVLAQARAARKLFAARGWQPWVCKP